MRTVNIIAYTRAAVQAVYFILASGEVSVITGLIFTPKLVIA